MAGRLRLNRRDLLKLGFGVAAAVAGTQALAQDRGRHSYSFGGYSPRRDDRKIFRQRNPVLYWNDVSLQLVALDHSIDSMELRVSGPLRQRTGTGSGAHRDCGRGSSRLSNRL